MMRLRQLGRPPVRELEPGQLDERGRPPPRTPYRPGVRGDRPLPRIDTGRQRVKLGR